MFKDKTWDQRVRTLGDPAEQAFELWADKNGLGYSRFGFNRPPFSMAALSTKLKHAPDYVTADGLYEIQGCGRDGLFKFKHAKLGALREWCEDDDVWLWLWNQTLDQCVTCHIDVIHRMCWVYDEGYREDGIFDGTKPYSQISWDQLITNG
mgnify:CR=1 FL=1